MMCKSSHMYLHRLCAITLTITCMTGMPEIKKMLCQETPKLAQCTSDPPLSWRVGSGNDDF